MRGKPRQVPFWPNVLAEEQMHPDEAEPILQTFPTRIWRCLGWRLQRSQVWICPPRGDAGEETIPVLPGRPMRSCSRKSALRSQQHRIHWHMLLTIRMVRKHSCALRSWLPVRLHQPAHFPAHFSGYNLRSQGKGRRQMWKGLCWRNVRRERPIWWLLFVLRILRQH